MRGGGIDTLLRDQSPTTTEQRAAVTGLAETMRLRATLLQYTGNLAEAAAVARRTQQVLEANGLSVSSTAAHSLRLLAGGKAIAGEYPAAAVFFSVGDSGSYGFFVGPRSATAYKIALTGGEIAQIVDRLRETTLVQPGGLPTPDFAASYRLYSALFGRVEKELQGVARVSIAATGDLLRYPLEALVTRAGVSDNNGDYRQVPFLVRSLARSLPIKWRYSPPKITPYPLFIMFLCGHRGETLPIAISASTLPRAVR